MRQCPACRKWFRNKQAIRQHLRWCRVYQTRKDGMKLVRCHKCSKVAEIAVDEPFECRYCGCPGYCEL